MCLLSYISTLVYTYDNKCWRPQVSFNISVSCRAGRSQCKHCANTPHEESQVLDHYLKFKEYEKFRTQTYWRMIISYKLKLLRIQQSQLKIKYGQSIYISNMMKSNQDQACCHSAPPSTNVWVIVDVSIDSMISDDPLENDLVIPDKPIDNLKVKRNAKAPHYWPFVMGTHGFLSQRASNP